MQNTHIEAGPFIVSIVYSTRPWDCELRTSTKDNNHVRKLETSHIESLISCAEDIGQGDIIQFVLCVRRKKRDNYPRQRALEPAQLVLH